MRSRYRRQAQNLDIVRLEAGNHIAGVQAAHAVRNDVYGFAVCFGGDVLAELQGALFDAAGRGDGGRDYFDAVCAHGVRDAAPVVNAGEETACYAELVEAEEAVG